jgi:glycosyltransferase involved in cell wall biosynthesis
MKSNHNIYSLSDKKILIVCSYYYPYVSGLTYIVTQIAEGMAAKGFQVIVLCHQHDLSLKRIEFLNNVKVVRAKKLFSINRAIVSLDYLITYLKLSSSSSLINLHLPLPEAGLLTLLSNTPKVSTYHCDIDNKGFSMRLFSILMDFSSIVSFFRSKVITFSSLDYANNSRLLNFTTGKIQVVPHFTDFEPSSKKSFKIEGKRNIGYLGRFTSEKGILILIKAFLALEDSDARLLLAGSSKLAGDSVLPKVRKLIANDSRISLYLDLTDEEKKEFYTSLDVFCFPSTNSFESFGIVQLEALLSGTPVISSDLPGVRILAQGKKYGIPVVPGSIESLMWGLKNTELRAPTLEEKLVLQKSYSKFNSLKIYETIFINHLK